VVALLISQFRDRLDRRLAHVVVLVGGGAFAQQRQVFRPFPGAPTNRMSVGSRPLWQAVSIGQVGPEVAREPNGPDAAISLADGLRSSMAVRVPW